jgi:protein-tyrosine-phosphatase
VSTIQADKVTLCQTWNPNATVSEVPDPYYGDLSDFRHVFKMLDIATDEILAALQKS